LKGLLVDVSTSKFKHAKSIITDILMRWVKNEYTGVLDYHAELLRSNPGSIVVVCLIQQKRIKIFSRVFMCASRQ
jgi:hypothetical protein